MSRLPRIVGCVHFCLLAWVSPILAQESSEQLLARARTVLVQSHGEIRLPGLIEPVEVLRDRWGIPHIYARNSHDLFFAQGFVAAQDRLFQIDMWRRMGVGETAEVFGEQAVEADRFARLLRYRGDMEAEWSSYSPDAQDIATAFTQGINAFIDQAGAKRPIEFQVAGYAPAKWRPEDVLAFRHPLSTLGPAFEQAFNLGPVPQSGDGHTPNNTRYNDGFEQIHGASYRQVLDLADWDRGLATNTPGQSGQPGSPHYGDLMALWAEAKYFPLAFSRARVKEVTQHRLALQP